MPANVKSLSSNAVLSPCLVQWPNTWAPTAASLHLWSWLWKPWHHTLFQNRTLLLTVPLCWQGLQLIHLAIIFLTYQLQTHFIRASPIIKRQQNTEVVTISVRKAISFSRLDKCEKCLSFSNSCERWCLIMINMWVKELHPHVNTAETSCGSTNILVEVLTSGDTPSEQLWAEQE